MLNDGGGPFSLTSAGNLTVDTSKGWLNYEVKTWYTVVVGLRETVNVLGQPPVWASDGNMTLSINVIDVNEAPYFSSVPGDYRVDEESNATVVVTPFVNGNSSVYIVVMDEDAVNNTVLSVGISSSAVGFGSGYFEVVANGTGGVCRGNMMCILRVRAGAPRMNFDTGLRNVSVSLNVTDNQGLVSYWPAFDVAIRDINQGRRGFCFPDSAVWLCWLRASLVLRIRHGFPSGVSSQ